MEIMVTNNPLVKEQYRNDLKVELLDADLPGVLIHVRDRVHKGYRLLTHPLSGSVKPNETPYKSVLISDDPGNLGLQPGTDLQSVTIIEECIQAVQKFTPNHIHEQYLPDLQTLDLTLIVSAVKVYKNGQGGV